MGWRLYTRTLALHDVVTVTAERSGATMITMSGDHPGVPGFSTSMEYSVKGGGRER